ncbi:MAG: Na/Pi symporter [Schleiferiaceae bacterium]|nr:Na/Pi symporter [Schleiferiaceae bacterium]
MDTIDYWGLIAGLGLFLFGIMLMEEAIKTLSGKAFKILIRKYTATPLRAVGTGTVATAILQSSSAVTLMTLAFVGAGIMQMSSAIGVVLGANLGTTVTSWLVASLGFKVKIEALAMPFVGIGGLMYLFLEGKPRAAQLGKLLLGFGLLFLGLDYMKVSISDFAENFDLSPYADYGRLFFFLIGVIITALVQSSSASLAIILTALFSGILTFETAAAMAIGANVGTTITVLIGAVGGGALKMRVAMSHLIFNFVIGVLALLFLSQLSHFVSQTLGLAHDPPIALAAFHTIVKAGGVLLFLPFTGKLADWLTARFPEKDTSFSKYISKLPAQLVPDATLASMEKETERLYNLMVHHNLALFDIDPKLVLPSKYFKKDAQFSKAKLYPAMKIIQGELFSLGSRLHAEIMDDEEGDRLTRLRSSVKYLLAAAKTLKDIGADLELLESTEHEWVLQSFERFRKRQLRFYSHLQELKDNPDDKQLVTGLHEQMKEILHADGTAMRQLTDYLSGKKADPVLVSAILNINRAMVLASRQVVFSMRELRLTQEQGELLDQLNPTR